MDPRLTPNEAYAASVKTAPPAAGFVQASQVSLPMTRFATAVCMSRAMIHHSLPKDPDGQVQLSGVALKAGARGWRSCIPIGKQTGFALARRKNNATGACELVIPNTRVLSNTIFDVRSAADTSLTVSTR